MNIEAFLYGLKDAIDNSTLEGYHCVISRDNGLTLYSDAKGIPMSSVLIEELITIRGTFYDVSVSIHHEDRRAVYVRKLYFDEDGRRVSERLVFGP